MARLELIQMYLAGQPQKLRHTHNILKVLKDGQVSVEETILLSTQTSKL